MPSPQKMADPADDVNVIDPVGRTVKFGGRDVQIMPMTVGKIPAVTRALRGVMIGGSSAHAIMALIAEHGDAVIEAAALATGLDLAEVREASLPEFVELFSAIVEVNASFFTQAVGTLVATIGAFGDGRTSSTVSSAPATASLT